MVTGQETASFGVDVAGLEIGVRLPGPTWLPSLVDRYAAFLADVRPGWRVELREDDSTAAEEPGWARHEGPVTHFHVRRYRGEIDLLERRAWVSAPSPANAASALERTLTYILMQALPRERNALLLHAAGVALQGRGYAFCGASGAGKTTVARLLRESGELFGDENMALRLTAGPAELVSTPFWGASAPANLVDRAARTAPLAAVFILDQATDFALERLSPGAAIAALLSSEKVATERVESASAWLDVAGRLVERVPVYTLGFRPTSELLPFLSRHFGESCG
jgi:hypothetical protein